MDTLTLTTTTITDTCSIQFFSQRIFHLKKLGFLTFPRNKSRKHLVFASKDEPQLDDWDKMELKFGRMIGEDPKLTLAKIMGRKSNPDISYLEIEKLFDKKKSKTLNEDVEEIPFDMSDETKPTKSTLGLNLVRPVPKKGIKFEATNKPVEPVSESKSSTPPVNKDKKERRSSVPDVILRKPSLFSEDDDENKKFSMFGMKPNLSLKMGKEPQKERFSDITLLKKPEPIASNPGLEEEKSHSDSTDDKFRDVYETEGSQKYGTGAAPLLQKPELRKLNFTEEADQDSSKEQTEFRSSNLMDDNMIEDVSHSDNQLVTATGGNSNQFQETKQKESSLDKGLATELQGDMWSVGETSTSDGTSERNSALYMETVLKVKPKRLDPSTTNQKTREVENPESLGNNSELDNFLMTLPIKEREDDDWARAEELVKARERGEVEIISASTRGFVVSFGSLIGFLPYRNLAARWKFLAFESWLRRRGLDPSAYRQNLGIIGKYEASSMIDTSESVADSEIGSKTSEAITSDMKLEDLLMIYDQEKLKFLLSFVGQKVRVGVVLADRNSRKLIFSIKPKEKEELVEKKRSLMAQLSVGDVVKCCIKKITYFGVFVELEGVPALIHQSEVSWDATLDPASYFKVGQIVDAKVHQLDFSMERIFLSLKEITPDPLLEALEAVVGDHEPLDGRLEAAQADSDWPDVESLIKELEQYDGIQSVSKGRYFLSPGLAPTFQVYMASMFENQYKLLARAGNKVQEVIVQTSLSKDDLKSAILTCTNRVE